jgi:hypothetical protein
MSVVNFDATILRSSSDVATASREECLLGEHCRSRDPLRMSLREDADCESLEVEGMVAESILSRGRPN